MESMRIDAPKGTKVVFSDPTAGYSGDQKTAKDFLVVGETYTVENTVIHGWSTDVYLQEVPNVSFNSVLFTEATA